MFSPTGDVSANKIQFDVRVTVMVVNGAATIVFVMFQSPGRDLSNLGDSGSFHQGTNLLAPWPAFSALVLGLGTTWR